MGRKVERFEDFEVWQDAVDLVAAIYRLTGGEPFRHDRALTDQMRRSAISIPANIAEGFERGTRAEFHRFLCIAKGSCAELRTHIHVARRIGDLESDAFRGPLHHAERVARRIGN